jgi:hypothetical protein
MAVQRVSCGEFERICEALNIAPRLSEIIFSLKMLVMRRHEIIE